MDPVRVLLDQARPLPPILRTVADSVYGEFEPLDTETGKPIESPEVLRHRTMAKVDLDEANLKPLLGLSLILRVANETVPAEEHETSDPQGWSISVLNVLPPFVQKGLNHPLFKLRQRGQTGATTTIEGVVVARDDRFVFQGTDTRRRLPFNATMRLPDVGLRRFREESGAPIMCTGIMLGLRSSGETFGTLFELLAVPGIEPMDQDDAVGMRNFRERYRAALEAAGVRNLRETVAELKKLGFTDEDLLKDRLREMRDRGPKPLRPF